MPVGVGRLVEELPLDRAGFRASLAACDDAVALMLLLLCVCVCVCV